MLNHHVGQASVAQVVGVVMLRVWAAPAMFAAAASRQHACCITSVAPSCGSLSLL